jgi:hypothetical protein
VADPWRGYYAAVAEDPAGVLAVLDVAREIGAEPRELAWAIELETNHSWSPAARNPKSNAIGLIQWMPRTLRDLGMPDTETMAALSRAGQAPYVRDYFRQQGAAYNMSEPGDVLLAIFSPGALGRSDSYVIAYPHTETWKANRAYASKGNGAITAGSVRKRGTPPATGGPGYDAPPPGTGTPVVTPGKSLLKPDSGIWLLVLAWLVTRK